MQGRFKGRTEKAEHAGRAMALGGSPFVRLPAICSLPVTPTKKGLGNNDHLILAFHLPRGTCSSHRSDRETLSQLSFMP